MSKTWHAWNENKRERYLGSLRGGMRRGEACKRAGVSRQTIMRVRHADPSFAQEEEQAEADACEQVENALWNKAMEGNVTAIQVYLYNRCPERWADKRSTKQEIQITSGPADLEDVKKKLLERAKGAAS